jgi:aryl-alcohol dehydrogenase-like predicted oxidoreductase
LGLGTWGLSGDGYGRVTLEEQDRVIERARAFGITLFETADSYAHGAMESKLGERLGGDDHAIFVTKWGTHRAGVPPRKRFDAKYLKECCDASRERLQREKLNVALLHNPSLEALERDDTTGTMAELEADGKLHAWGVSAGSPEVAVEAVKRGASVVSVAYNLFHQKDLDALSEAERFHEVGVLAHSVLSYGLLSGQWTQFRNFRAPDHRAERWSADEIRKRVRQLDAVRPAVGGVVPSMRSVALRFVLERERVGSLILGPKNCMQLDQLVREAGKEPPYLAPERLQALKNRLADSGVDT